MKKRSAPTKRTPGRAVASHRVCRMRFSPLRRRALFSLSHCLPVDIDTADSRNHAAGTHAPANLSPLLTSAEAVHSQCAEPPTRPSQRRLTSAFQLCRCPECGFFDLFSWNNLNQSMLIITGACWHKCQPRKEVGNAPRPLSRQLRRSKSRPSDLSALAQCPSAPPASSPHAHLAIASSCVKSTHTGCRKKGSRRGYGTGRS